MSWVIVAVSAYFLFAIVFVIDKYLLGGPIPSPKAYSFYVGILQALAVLLIPFVGFSVLDWPQLFLVVLAGMSYILGLVWFYKALQLYEASRVTPALGGMIPLFTALLVFILSGAVPDAFSLFALLLLISGTILITYNKSFSWDSLKISALSAFFWALHFVLAKYVYSESPFWTSFIWLKIGGALAALLLLLSKEARESLFSKKISLPKRTTGVFFLNQGMGAAANVLQNWAISLAPLAAVSLVLAFQGVQYVFLFIIAILFSFKLPQLLKEETSGRVILQKIIAIILITSGMFILSA
jgi:drug/metabolite transporter (DMT)-like permease